MNLKQARENGELEQFIKEHEKDAPGDGEGLSDAIDRLAVKKKKSTQGASEQD